MSEPAKFPVLVRKEDLKIFTELLTKRKVNFRVLGFYDDRTILVESVLLEITLYPSTRKNFDKEEIWELYSEGNSYREIAKQVGCSKSYVEKILNGNILRKIREKPRDY